MDRLIKWLQDNQNNLITVSITDKATKSYMTTMYDGYEVTVRPNQVEIWSGNVFCFARHGCKVDYSGDAFLVTYENMLVTLR